MATLLFKRPCGGIVALSSGAMKTVAEFIQTEKDDTEAGGILLGRLILDCKDVVVDEATKPAPEDRRSRFFFRRSNKPALRRVVEAWHTSGGTLVYLGDWHTHPEDIPHPSCVDRRNWKRIIKKSTYEQDFLLFVIVGRKETCIWQGRKDGQIEQLAKVQMATDVSRDVISAS